MSGFGQSRWTHLVVRQVDADPPEVYPFEDLASAEEFYDRAREQWSETYLVEILKGPVA